MTAGARAARNKPTTEQSWDRGIGQANQRFQHKTREGTAEAAKRGQRGKEQQQQWRGSAGPGARTRSGVTHQSEPR